MINSSSILLLNEEVTVYGEQVATKPGMQYADNRMKAISCATDDIKRKAAAAVNVTATLYSY
jgi:hypothetical protein